MNRMKLFGVPFASSGLDLELSFHYGPHNQYGPVERFQIYMDNLHHFLLRLEKN